MPFEKGGRADKQGNRYEKDCIIYEMIKVLNERNYSVVIEPLGINVRKNINNVKHDIQAKSIGMLRI